MQVRGHHVYIDNLYTSPALFSDLRDMGFGACGTVRANRRGMPAEFKQSLAMGEVRSVAIDESITALKWADKRQVHMLSTLHDDAMVTKVRRTCQSVGGGEETSDGGRIQQVHGWGRQE